MTLYGEVNKDDPKDVNITSYEDDPVDVGITSQRSQASNVLDCFYEKFVILEEKLFSKEIQAAVGNNYRKLVCF